MGCITSSNFSILVNVTALDFFPASRGIKQGCPHSPLLFSLIIEGLSILIKDARYKGHIQGIKISCSLSLNHLLFVDDIILFGVETLEEWKDFA